MAWIVQYAVPLAGITGAFLYGVLRLAYVFFYLRVRATPEEVGYGYTQILAAELIGAVELVLFVALLLFAIGTAVAVVVRVSRRRAAHRPSRRTLWPLLQSVAIRCTAAAVVVVLIGLPAVGWLEGAEAAKGFTVRNVYLAHTIRLPVLAVQAVPALVEWTGPATAHNIDVNGRRCLLYLGEFDDISVFYDVRSRESLRLPTAQIIVSLQNVAAVPESC